MRRVLRHVQNCDTDQQGKNFHMYSIDQSLDDKYYINQMGCIELLTSFSSAVRRSSTSCCFLFSSAPFLFIFSLHCCKLCRGIRKKNRKKDHDRSHKNLQKNIERSSHKKCQKRIARSSHQKLQKKIERSCHQKLE